MAKETQTVLKDDLDGSAADRTVQFTWDGNNYELELSKKNVQALEKALKPYIDAARKVRGGGAQKRGGQRAAAQRSSSERSTSGRASRRGRASSSASSNGNKRDLGAIREWAAQNGYNVSARGRISSSIVEAYEAAHS
jgi:hypothetical protein